MVMAQSLFKLLKARDPNSIIHVLAPAWTFSLLACMPEVALAIEMPFSHGELQLSARYQLARTLRKQRYDQAIVLPNSFKSALIPWFARIPKRTGWLGECRYGVLNDSRKLDKKRYPLMIEQFMALGLPKGAPLPSHYYPEFHVSHASSEAVLAKIKPIWRDRPILGLGAGQNLALLSVGRSNILPKSPMKCWQKTGTCGCLVHRKINISLIPLCS